MKQPFPLINPGADTVNTPKKRERVESIDEILKAGESSMACLEALEP
jgi:hypothetical protein